MRDAVSNFSTALREFLNMFSFLRVIYYYLPSRELESALAR
jgi:hypothetical protein